MYSFCVISMCSVLLFCFFFQAEDGIRDLVRSRGLGDVYKRQILSLPLPRLKLIVVDDDSPDGTGRIADDLVQHYACLLYTSDAADERSSVDLGGRRIIKKKTRTTRARARSSLHTKRENIETRKY